MILPLRELDLRMSDSFGDEPGLWPISKKGVIYPLGKSGPESELRLREDGPAIGELFDNQAVITVTKSVAQHLGYGNVETVFIGSKEEISQLWDVTQSLLESIQKMEEYTLQAKALLIRPSLRLEHEEIALEASYDTGFNYEDAEYDRKQHNQMMNDVFEKRK